MADATAALFESLKERGHEPLLGSAEGTIRFELTNGRGERWLVTLGGGDVAVARAGRKADCTVRTRKEVFESLASGRANALAATLRGELTVEGDLELFTLFQRVFPARREGRGTDGVGARP